MALADTRVPEGVAGKSVAAGVADKTLDDGATVVGLLESVLATVGAVEVTAVGVVEGVFPGDAVLEGFFVGEGALVLAVVPGAGVVAVVRTGLGAVVEPLRVMVELPLLW